MTRMKDSGIEWIGEVPEEWGIVRLKDCLEINNGKDYKDIETDETGYPVIGSGGQFAYARKYLHDGTAILLGRKGTIDKPLYIEGKFWTVDTMFYGVPKSGIHAKFIYYVALQIPFGLYSTNTALPSMTQTDLQNHHFVMPPLDEQTQIADFLDKKVAQLDKVKSLLEEQIKTLEDYRQSLIYETVTKGLDKTVPLKDSGVDWIGQIPEGWGVKSFKYAVTIKDGTHDTPEYFVEGVPLITSKNLDSIHNEIDFEGAKNISFDDHRKISQRSDVKKGDILMPMIGTVGGATQVLVEKEFSIKNVALFKVAHDEALSRFLYYQLNSSWINSQLSFMMSGGVQSFISLNMLSKVKLIIPTSEEIKKISLFLDSGVGKINQMIFIKKEQIENINKQRQTLIYDYVTGKRRV
ncbi:TPA: restriction endonuclease subunit S [Streptococcus suis]|nr:restriction endonuclease subunit S [Streptococcus suis]